MSIHNTTETSILALVFNATAWTGIAQNHGTPDTVLGISLQTADPTDSAADMTTSEVAYTSYARVNTKTRDTNGTTGWTVSGTTPTKASPTTAITFPAGTGGSGTVTHFCVGKTGTTTQQIYWSGTVTPSIVTGNGITPSLTTATGIELD